MYVNPYRQSFSRYIVLWMIKHALLQIYWSVKEKKGQCPNVFWTFKFWLIFIYIIHILYILILLAYICKNVYRKKNSYTQHFLMYFTSLLYYFYYANVHSHQKSYGLVLSTTSLVYCESTICRYMQHVLYEK